MPPVGTELAVRAGPPRLLSERMPAGNGINEKRNALLARVLVELTRSNRQASAAQNKDSCLAKAKSRARFFQYTSSGTGRLSRSAVTLCRAASFAAEC